MSTRAAGRPGMDVVRHVGARLGRPVTAVHVAAGSTAPQAVAEHVAREGARTGAGQPLVVVPAGRAEADRPILRVLVPMDRDVTCTAASRRVAARLRDAGCGIVGLHVLEPATTPAFLDHPGHGVESWRDELAHRYELADLRVRRGDPGARIVETARDLDVDLVVLAWSGVLDEQHGRVVAAVLADAAVPVLLVPAEAP